VRLTEDHELAQAALLIVDVMNDFVKPQGAKIVVGLSSLSKEDHDLLVTNNQRLIRAFRAAGRPIMYVRGEYRPDGLDSAQAWVKRRKQRFPKGMKFKEIGSWGAQIIDEIAPEDGDVVIIKKGHSGFGFTDIDPVLRHLGIELCVATGGGAPGCLSDTVRQGAGQGYDFWIVPDAAYKPNHEVLPTLADECGRLVTTDEVLDLLKVPIAVV
jgi:nicotinamidase-related amidase